MWLKLLAKLLGPIVGLIAEVAGSDWDADKAVAVFKGIAKNPPRQAVKDEDRARLEALAEGE